MLRCCLQLTAPIGLSPLGAGGWKGSGGYAAAGLSQKHGNCNQKLVCDGVLCPKSPSLPVARRSLDTIGLSEGETTVEYPRRSRESGIT